MDTFTNLNDNIVYTKVKSRSDAVSLKEKAKEKSLEGVSVAIFFDKNYHLYLAPGHDPYQVRNDIDSFLTRPKTKKVSKKQALVPDAENNNPETSNKKSFWDRLK